MRARTALTVLLTTNSLLFACATTANDGESTDDEVRSGSGSVHYADQGWDAATRDRYYHTAIGSEIMPFAWFRALEQPGGIGKLTNVLGRYGFVESDAPPSVNPHRLPLGFAVAKNEETGKLYGDPEWIGLSCAACHTGDMTIGGKKVRIDGAPSMIDMIGFQEAVLATVQATLQDPKKWNRFANDVGGRDAEALRARVTKFAQTFAARLARSPAFQRDGVVAPSGPGRVDGLGIANNETLCKLTEIGSDRFRAMLENPDNCRESQPASSFPHLWGAPRLEWVEWTGNVHVTYLRNVGAVSAGFGSTWVEGDGPFPRFRSSSNVQNLHQVESQLAVLKPPSWRSMAKQGLVPTLDETLVARGASLYEQNCNRCHAVTPELTAPNAKGYQYWKIAMPPIEEVGTDRTHLDLHYDRKVKLPAILKLPFVAAFGAAAIGPNDEVVASTYRGLITHLTGKGDFEVQGLQGQEAEVVSDCRDGRRQPLKTYRGRALDGIAFTAPFLHNGSVPTLDDLLKPAAARPRSFFIGCRTFDAQRLGYACTKDEPNAVLFDTTLPANSNAGHEFGTQLPETDKRALLEFIKSIEEPTRPPVPTEGLCKF